MISTQNNSSSRKLHVDPRVMQIDPSDGYAYYEISDNADGSNPLAKIVATASDDPRYDTGMVKNTEYWQISGNALNTSGCTGPLYVTKVRSGKWVYNYPGRPPFNAVDADFSISVIANWVGAASASCHKASGPDYGFVVNVSKSGDKWQGTMSFYRSSGDLIFKAIADKKKQAFCVPGSPYGYSDSCEITLP